MSFFERKEDDGEEKEMSWEEWESTAKANFSERTLNYQLNKRPRSNNPNDAPNSPEAYDVKSMMKKTNNNNKKKDKKGKEKKPKNDYRDSVWGDLGGFELEEEFLVQENGESVSVDVKIVDDSVEMCRQKTTVLQGQQLKQLAKMMRAKGQDGIVDKTIQGRETKKEQEKWNKLANGYSDS